MLSAADLPRDILHHIQSLLPVVDYVRFSAVCSSWRSAARHNPLPPQAERVPWIIYFEKDDAKNAVAAVAVQFFPEQDTNKYYRIPIPKSLQHLRILNSIGHRLVLKNAWQEMWIVNPFSSSSWNQICCCCACRPIPPLSSVRVGMPSRHWNRAVTDGTLVIAQLGRYGHSLAYTRLGSDRWIKVEDVVETALYCLDILPSPSQPGLFYGTTRAEWCLPVVFALDFSSSYSSFLSSTSCPPPSCEFVDMTYNLRIDYIDKENPEDGDMVRDDMRLVISSSDLFLVRWRLMKWLGEKEGEVGFTRPVDVYKLSLDGRHEKQRWARVTTLGGRSFFLGHHQSISLPSLEAPPLKSDRIYLPLYPFHNGTSDTCYNIDELKYQVAYNLGDESWDWLFGTDDESHMELGWRTAWITPCPSELAQPNY